MEERQVLQMSMARPPRVAVRTSLRVVVILAGHAEGASLCGRLAGVFGGLVVCGG